MKLTIDGSQSQASYKAREQLLGRNLPSDAVGTTKNVSGNVVLSVAGEPIPEQSQVSVDLASLTSDERRRDNFIKSDTLQTSRFPSATFVARDVEGLTTPLPT
ncbi:MAG TPA: YceI family protein, partial [Chloroflexota bacterium]|nr:YceI family protein [Chloroflexota bacterium]